MIIGDLDPSTSLSSQFHEKTGPIVLINTIIVPRENMTEFLDTFREDAAFMKGSPGLISTQLHRGTADSQLLVNVAIWESTEALFNAYTQPEFQQAAAKYPEGVTAYPHIFEKIAIEGICVA